MCAYVFNFAWVLILCHWVRAEVFTAITDLEPLLTTQQRVIDDITQYIISEERRLLNLEERINIYQKEHEKAMQDIPDYLGNPISAFTLIKRLTTDLDFIRKIIQDATDTSRNIMINHEDLTYPTLEDLSGAAQGISRLQDVYKLDTHALSEGVLNGVVCSNPMTVEDCFELGRTLFNVGDYEAALSWMTEALEKYKKNCELCHFSDLVENIIATYSHLGDLQSAFEMAKQVLKINPENVYAANLTINLAKLVAEEETLKMIKELSNITEDLTEGQLTDEELIFLSDVESCKAICRGEVNMPSSMEKSLYCQYLSKNPFLKIAPFKVEYMSLQPQILIYHDVISDAEIKFIQDNAKPTLRRSEVRVNPDVSVASTARISKMTWIRNSETAVIPRLTRRTSDMTGLSMDTAEDLQVVNYGIGGHQEVHKDFLRPETLTQLVGNRIATVLFYLSDVAEGGATVFPRPRVRLLPRKGTAAVWYNLHSSGEGDWTTRHASCPVLRGSKWIATKWIHEAGQEFLKPCDLNYIQNIPNTVTKAFS